MDFVKKLRPGMSSQGLVRTGQISTLVLVVLACLWAPQIEKFSSLWEYLQIVLSFIAPPIAAAFIAGLFSKRVNGTGAFTSLMTGFVISVIFVIMALTEADNWFTQMHFLHRTFYLFVVCMIVNFAVSYATALPELAKVRDYTWDRAIIAEETRELEGVAWYKNYRIQSIALLIITAILVAFFW